MDCEHKFETQYFRPPVTAAMMERASQMFQVRVQSAQMFLPDSQGLHEILNSLNPLQYRQVCSKCGALKDENIQFS